MVIKEGNSDLETSDLTSGWLFSEAIREFYSLPRKDSLTALIPTALSTRFNEEECIDFFLTQPTEPLINFLTFKKSKSNSMIYAD